jgi:enamine deaminase RidA (YjgF/YER057c/UK114 family)
VPHTFLNPDGLAPPVGFSHVAIAEPGRSVHLAGLTAHGADGTLEDGDTAAQFAAAIRNVGVALDAAGAAPGDVVNLTIYVTDVEEYLAQLGPIGESYRSLFGRHYPPMALLGVARLFDASAKVELVATAVIADDGVRP